MIREWEIKDLEDIENVEKVSFSVPWSIEAFRQEYLNERAYYLVIEIEEQVIGYGGFWKIFDEGHITNIAIAPQYRNQGLGTSLIKAMLEKAVTLDINRMTLEVRASNEIALKAYHALGFNIEGKRSRYYTNPTEDAMIMWRSL